MDVKQRLEDHPYWTVIALVFTALSLQLAGSRLVHLESPYLFFFLAIALASWIGGAAPGLAATALSVAVIDSVFITPVGSFAVARPSDLATLAVFASEGLAICGLFHLLQRSHMNVERSLESCEVARERAEESNQLKRNFIANMSHEIRAPLSAVLGYSELLAGEHVPKHERESYTERLKLNAAALTHLVTDLLDVTEINSAYFVANRKRMNLSEFVQNAYALFSPLAAEKGLKFQIQLRGALPAYIESDPEQMIQILRHVIGNAIRFSESGLIKMTVTASEADSGRREAALIVSDEGPGIASEIKQKIFKPFPPNDIDKPAKTHGGTGLGLTIARKLARGLGGDVKLVKSNRRGTTFLITVDAGTVDLAHDFFDQLAMPAPPVRISPDDPHGLDGIRVLVVDDSPDSALLVGRMLKVVGADVETAERGEEGIEKALEKNPDVVLMDIQMPEMDGNETIRRLRALGFKKPIIALSAHVLREDREEAKKSGSDEYLMKPVSRRALLELVGRYASKTPAPALQSHS